MVEPLACCLHGIERAEVEAGDRRRRRARADWPHAVRRREGRGRPGQVVGGRPERRELAGEFGAEPGTDEAPTSSSRRWGRPRRGVTRRSSSALAARSSSSAAESRHGTPSAFTTKS